MYAYFLEKSTWINQYNPSSSPSNTKLRLNEFIIHSFNKPTKHKAKGKRKTKFTKYSNEKFTSHSKQIIDDKRCFHHPDKSQGEIKDIPSSSPSKH